MKELLHKAHEATFNQLLKQDVNLRNNGSTALSVIITESRIFIANVGDSRVIKGYQNPRTFPSLLPVKETWTMAPLSDSHSPTNASEVARIVKNGGEILPHQSPESLEFQGPPRIWFKGLNFPGIC